MSGHFNNVFFGGGIAGVVQNTRNFSLEFSKTAATGTRFAIRNLTNYNQDNSPLNRFPQHMGNDDGRGVSPSAVARRRDGVQPQSPVPILGQGFITVSCWRGSIPMWPAIDFEVAIRNLVRDVELTYWELSFAYRQLDAERMGREAARENLGGDSGQAPGRRRGRRARGACSRAVLFGRGAGAGRPGRQQPEHDQ